MEGEKRVILTMALIVGSVLASSYIMFLGFNQAVGNPFITVLVIVAIWIVGLIGSSTINVVLKRVGVLVVTRLLFN